MTKKNELTPHDAAQFIDSLSPVDVKNRLLDLLLWQSTHGKTTVHLNWYIRKMQEPKPKWPEGFGKLIKNMGMSA